MSVGENIAYGLPDDHVSRDDVIKAAKAANAHDFILSLPQVCHCKSTGLYGFLLGKVGC